MKVLNEVLSPETSSQTITNEAASNVVPKVEQAKESPDYTEMMIEIQKIGEPVSFESLKEFYNIK